ncbi:D-alanyl-D-alanine carboxypeptidase/D-alanyl-D-alanine-endopeptidase [Ornithinimicrobium sediminis]|uniref:D-alanyl-D-alanine carboxypeptidase/D-alanyl-D-alanine-endopeptidase n=1 Tax=Ornithinimicrobium sediminis TaxID=2904603 RepID=UPI001E3B0F6D|nr:D-alanyl-D-alanine carboxypeptidase [Ornithinimicrobium sediminis]MCE0485807.1 D-alanyl-D-alanine carboxypeptidase [Ornithinimicrobium sediminis]
MSRARISAGRTVAGLGLALVLAGGPSLATGTGTQDDAPPESILSAQAAVRPVPAGARPALDPVQQGALPTSEGVLAAVDDAWDSRWLGRESRRSLVVQDVQSGQVLVDLRGDTALTPASTVKLLTAAAVTVTVDPEETFPTRVVAGARPGEVVLVAGGDLLLRSGAGDPDAVVGRAGLADLAEQTAAALADASRAEETDGAEATAAGPVRVLLDTAYAEGADVAPGWTDYWVDTGYAGRVTMLGLQQDRAVPFDPSPADPPLVAAEAFRDALVEAGVEVDESDVVRTDPVADDAEVLAEVRSAPLRDVLGLALASSDNAMVEQLARQAAVRDGADADQESVNDWVLSTLRTAYGLDTTDAVLADTSGLSDGTELPMRLVAEVVTAGADGSRPGLQSVLARLPVAGYTGTLWDRFALDDATDGVGVVRAKTGSLPGTTSLAGTVVTADDRLLAFAVSATDIGPDGQALEARAVVDALVSDLAACGC